LTLIVGKISSSGFSPTVTAAYFILSFTLIAFCFAAAKDYDIASCVSLYLFNKIILLYFSMPFTFFMLLLLKALYNRGLYKCHRSLFALTMSILNHNY